MYYVYVLRSDKINKYYVGYTEDINKRLEHHNLGLDRWSKRGTPWKLIYTERYNSKKGAITRERYLKSGVGRKFTRAGIAKSVTARV